MNTKPARWFGVLLALVAPAALSAPCAGFTDVEAADPFCPSVAWMKNRAITTGCNATEYCPHLAVTRLQMAAFLYRLGVQNAFLQGGNAFGTGATLGTTDAQPLTLLVEGAAALRLQSDGAGNSTIVAGHAQNVVDPAAYGSVIGGGGGGVGSQCTSGTVAPVSRTCQNVLGNSAFEAVVAGGAGNVANGSTVAIGGGQNNTATGAGTTVGGGSGNTVAGLWSTVAGGFNSTASGDYAMVAGGRESLAGGTDSFAAGRRANAGLPGCHVWSDASSANPTSCFANNEYVARAVGGFYFWTSGSSDATYAGARLAPGAGAWAAYSDRAGKDNFEDVDPIDVAAKLASLRIGTWNWKAQPAAVRHMGPTAQDFRATFGLGDDDRTITTVDTDGVALAAIQGVYRLVQRKDAEIAALRGELAALRDAVVALRQAVAR
jgi:hypothetical protein